MIPRSVVGLISLLVLGAAVAQRDCKPGPYQAAYLEGLGPGGYGSINYERLVADLRGVHIHARAGLGTERFKDFTRSFNPDLTFPIGALFLKGGRWLAEAGGGLTITSFVYPDERDFRPERRQAAHVWLNAGLRYAPEFRGWVLRAAYTPLVEFGQWRHWGGFSVGYMFR